LGGDGELYGVTTAGGANGVGVIYKMTTVGVPTKLVDLAIGGDSGSSTIFALNGSSGGVVYGGNRNSLANASIFSIDPSGTRTTIFSLTNVTTQGNLLLALVLGGDGNLYGMTELGGANNVGTIFKVTPGGVFTKLHDFASAPTDLSGNYLYLIYGSDGNLYGTCDIGGTNNNGGIFKCTTAGVFTLLYSFSATGTADGAAPRGLCEGPDGKLYGVCSSGGTDNAGTVWVSNKAVNNFTVVHSFANPGTDGSEPNAPPIAAVDGCMYGITSTGGTTGGYGTIYQITTAPAVSILYSFPANQSQGLGAASSFVGAAE
jgi:uncharacterized repeat protein (TIGR03803 family)